MEEIRNLMQDLVSEGLVLATLSKPRKKSAPEDKPLIKVRIKPVLKGKAICYQAEEFRGTQAFHINCSAEEIVSYTEQMMANEFLQMQAQSGHSEATCLISSKGKVTIKRKKISAPSNETEESGFSAASCPAPVRIEHNRKKRYIIPEGRPVPFLMDLGVMTKEGAIVQSRYDKFRQINRFLEYIRDILPSLPRNRELTIIDFGCGKSYLTFAVYYYLHELEHLDVRIIGLDLKKDVIDHCNQVSKTYGYDKLTFLCGDIARFEGVETVDLVMTLHACDTATDYALAKAVKWGATCILSVPCCQHELNGQMDHPYMDTVLSYGILKERTAAILTDGIRGQVLDCMGYRTQLLEFIDMAHTPKNILIRAVYDGHRPDQAQIDAIDAVVRDFHLQPTILNLLEIHHDQAK